MCTSPLNLYVNSRHIGMKKKVFVPCGKCFECLNQYQNSWKLRMNAEYDHYKKAVFFTLTYREDAIPFMFDKETGEIYENEYKGKKVRLSNGRQLTITGLNYTHNIKHVQDNLRRFREREGYPDFTYYITTEIGTRTLRSHYHGILFGLDSMSAKSFFDDWQQRFGFVSYSDVVYDFRRGRCPQAVSSYVSKYCSKGVFISPTQKDMPDGSPRLGKVPKDRHLISKGLGKSFLTPQMYSFYLCEDSVFKDCSSDLFTNFEVESSRHRIYGDSETWLDEASGRLYSESFLAELLSRWCVKQTDVVNKKTYKYKLPRYYADKIFKKADSPSVLSCSLAEYISCVNDYKHQIEEQRLLSEHPDWDSFQAIIYMDNQETMLHQVRSQNIQKSLYRLYNTSIV